MAVQRLSSTGHESVEGIPISETGSLGAGVNAILFFDDAADSAEVVAALRLIEARVTQMLG